MTGLSPEARLEDREGEDKSSHSLVKKQTKVSEKGVRQAAHTAEKVSGVEMGRCLYCKADEWKLETGGQVDREGRVMGRGRGECRAGGGVHLK